VKLKVPVAVGVPVIVPSEASDNPSGKVFRADVSVHVNGGTPPAACSVVVGYTAFSAPFGKVVVVTCRGRGAPIAIVRGRVEKAPVESVTLIVKFEFTWAVGVPEIVTEFVTLGCSDNPVVSDPAEIDQVNGATPPVAVTVAV
jgi:hypothetical protein